MEKKLIVESLNDFLKEDYEDEGYDDSYEGEDEEEDQDSEYSFAVLGLDADDTDLQDLEQFNDLHDVAWFHTEEEANDFYEDTPISNRYLVKILKSSIYI